MTSLQPANWLPIAIDLRVSPPRVTWLDMGTASFGEPFFQQTVDRRLAAGARVRTTSLQELLLTGDPEPAPTGFIFHMSRCGSTAVANLLRAMRGSRVFAEARLLNQILAAPPGDFGSPGQVATFRAALRALGGSGEGPRFVKFSSWNVLHLPLVRSAFPGVPWVFVYRDPVEVMVANVARPGSWLRTHASAARAPAVAAALTGIDPSEMAGLTPEEYCARALGNFCCAALAAPPEGRLLINHRDLSPALLPSLLAFFGCAASAEEEAAMVDCLGVDAKDPARRPFVPDAAARQAAASPRVRELAQEWVMGAYEQLQSGPGLKSGSAATSTSAPRR